MPDSSLTQCPDCKCLLRGDSIACPACGCPTGKFKKILRDRHRRKQHPRLWKVLDVLMQPLWLFLPMRYMPDAVYRKTVDSLLKKDRDAAGIARARSTRGSASAPRERLTK